MRQSVPAVSLNERLKALSALGKVDDAEYRLGPGDLVEVSVFGVESLRQTLRINASGKIKLPLLDAIDAAGLTPAQLEERVASVLEGEVVKNPQVTVFVREYRSQPVYVLGAVRTPGQYQMTQQLRIVDIISMAGGLQSNAVDDAVIQRRTEDGAGELIKINLKQLIEDGDLTLNVVVRGGDVVHVNERLPETIYMIGEVARSGAYGLPPKQTLRVSQAFAWAGGPLKTAKMSEGILVRYENGERQELPVDFAGILKGKKQDFEMRPNDIIFVPGSTAKSLGYSLLNLVPSSLMQLPFYIGLP